MKNFLLLIFSIVIFCMPVYANDTDIQVNSYNKADTISFEEYLYLKKTRKDLKSLKLNHNGDVIFKNKVVLTDKGIPLNDNTAYTDTEFKILFIAKGIKPKKNCNPKDILKNGSLGCFIDNPDEK